MGARGAQDALPDGVAQSLREAFAAEVAVRLPHLRDGASRTQARRDVHTLAASAWMVGERALSELARAVEGQLEHSQTSADLPSLVVALEGFQP